ncbi:hypothetical protein N665_0018s0026 [Sinapis alba]|nr:hypothetical protein N665_0018s0026 [Sinapis alba]
MKEVIRMKDPQGLPNFIATVLRMETSTFSKVLSEGPKGDSRQQRDTSQYAGRYGGFYNNQSRMAFDKQRGALPDPNSQKENITPPKTFQRPRQRHSDAELDQMRREGICFKCGDKWSKVHEAKCPNKEFRILTVLNGFEVELVEETEEETHKSFTISSTKFKTLSMDAFLGIDTPKTTKLHEKFGHMEVIVMLDSGASHNFSSPRVVNMLYLKICAASSLDVLLGN